MKTPIILPEMPMRGQIQGPQDIDINSIQESGQESGNHMVTLLHKNIKRKYLLYIPKSYDGTNPVPLILVLHGGAGTPTGTQRLSRMSEKADQEGFLVIYPQSHVSRNGFRHWNAGPRPLEPYKESPADDVGFLNRILDDMEKRFNIDERRIYATGISNGGMMIYRMACEMSHRIAAVAPIATASLMNQCRPKRPISILHIHGRKDKIIQFEGGGTHPSVPNFIKRTVPLKSAQKSIEPFVSLNKCPPAPREIFQNAKAKCLSYGPGENKTEVVLCTVEDGGHTWPGGAHTSEKAWYLKLVGKLSQDINASDMMWDFFKRHPL
ncbi:hypothetical protein BVX98_01510 [bacterium F11]|nr:hypothetical protein BVX98_01510 [bacterium F11]